MLARRRFEEKEEVFGGQIMPVKIESTAQQWSSLEHEQVFRI
jgi:hypothetical protein